MYHNTEAEKIYDTLSKHHNGKFGYVIFRCTYRDDAEWEQFMLRLSEYVNAGLAYYEKTDIVKDLFEWTVIEDKAALQVTTINTVRK